LSTMASDKSGEKPSNIYRFINSEEKRRSKYEISRLLYVACTRARKNTYLLANVNTKKGDELSGPDSRSLLSHIYDAIKPRIQLDVETKHINELHKSINENSNTINKLVDNWIMPDLPVCNLLEKYRGITRSPKGNFPNHDWNPAYSKVVGTVVHRILRQIAIDGLAQWDESKIIDLSSVWERQLAQFGMTSFMLTTGVNDVIKHIKNALNSDVLKKAFDSKSLDSEKAITHFSDGEFNHYIIDSTFVSDDGHRWIIDYKTDAIEANQSKGEFIEASIEKHTSQLSNYKQAYYHIDHVQPKIGLFMTSENMLIPIDTDPK
ncbi:MAG: hypothetical protein QM500_21335, partial [Methylococcales bacterium]